MNLTEKKSFSPLGLLLPYQRTWVDDGSRFKIGLWSRQVGKSFACAAEAVKECLLRPGAMWVVLSAGERQALEFMEKAKQWARAFEYAIESYAEERSGKEALIKSAEIRWKNGSRMLALPANANTARGYSANLILDEFAFHENPEEIWRGIYPSISNPLRGKFKLRIVSTANGKANKFFDLWTKNESYSKHLVTIYDAVKAGLGVDVEELRTGLGDPEGWQQEFECEFIDGASVLLPYELLTGCESKEASEVRVGNPQGGMFYGIDVGRKHDLTVIWGLEQVGDTLWTREVTTLEKMPFHEQLKLIEGLLDHCEYAAIDATGIGAMLAEELTRKHGQKIEECQFNSDFKKEIFNNLRRRFEDKTVRIPVSRAIREDLHGIQKMTSCGGDVRYTAPQNDDGHCDRATALALALKASKKYSAAISFQPFSKPSRVAQVIQHRKDRTL